MTRSNPNIFSCDNLFVNDLLNDLTKSLFILRVHFQQATSICYGIFHPFLTLQRSLHIAQVQPNSRHILSTTQYKRRLSKLNSFKAINNSSITNSWSSFISFSRMLCHSVINECKLTMFPFICASLTIHEVLNSNHDIFRHISSISKHHCLSSLMSLVHKTPVS